MPGILCGGGHVGPIDLSSRAQPIDLDHDAVRDGWEALTGFPRATCAPNYFTREHLLSLFTRAPKAFWRFDVDLSLDAAVRMAEFAQIAGVRGTFYVRPDAEFYAPFSNSAQRALLRIEECGHRLGVHVDERCAPDPSEHGGMPGSRPLVAVARASALAGAGWQDADWNVLLVSFHMPTPDVLWLDFGGFDNAYASRWEGRYVSDSRREWDAEKEARLTANGGEGMQCALHAEHWAL